MDKERQAEVWNEQIERLIGSMTLEEKVFQTMNWSPAIERLGIKAYNWWNEGLHGVARAGVATVFPQAIGLAATFDEDFLEEIAAAVSTEARAKYNMQVKYEDTDIYKGLTLWAPNVNIFRDPRWGRGHETYGEDPYLTSRLGVRFVKGLQGHDEQYLKSAACAKHFAVHSGPEELRHSFNAQVSEKDLRETYLPAFKACVREGKVEAVMGAYNRTNGSPCCGHPYLLKKILREEWGFEGHVVSDCWAIKDFHEGHHVTDSPEDSAAMAMNNGCDLNCGNLFVYLLQAVKAGKVKEERLDEALRHLFTTRMKLGMLEEKKDHIYDHIPYSVVDCSEMQELNLKAARRSVVLLKNKDNILPLDIKRYRKIGVIGPNANSRKALVGNYEGTSSRYVTVLEGIQDFVGENGRVYYSEGCHLYQDKVTGLGTKHDRLSEVKGVCEESDIIIACMGLDASLEGEQGDTGNIYAGGDKENLELPGLQSEIIRTAYESGKPVILVMLTGSAMSLTWEDEHLAAIIQAWYPGALGGHAVADILFGEVNPEGKLPVTFYKTTEELPDFQDYSMKGRTYRYMEQEALYPFGYGLSYTDFSYKNSHVQKSGVDESGLDIETEVTNCGLREGVETVQVYVKSMAVKDGPNAQLKGMKKVRLLPGETQNVSIHLDLQSFGLFDDAGVYSVRKGDYRVYIGGSQPDARSVMLRQRKVDVMEVSASKNYELK